MKRSEINKNKTPIHAKLLRVKTFPVFHAVKKGFIYCKSFTIKRFFKTSFREKTSKKPCKPL